MGLPRRPPKKDCSAVLLSRSRTFSQSKACTRERTALSGSVAASTSGERFGRTMRLRDLRVGQVFDPLHRPRRPLGSGYRFVQQERTAILGRLVDTSPCPCPEQAVAAAEVVVEKAERRAHGEGVQPERDLGEFHRHRVLVDAVDAALEHHAADDVAGRRDGRGRWPSHAPPRSRRSSRGSPRCGPPVATRSLPPRLPLRPSPRSRGRRDSPPG